MNQEIFSILATALERADQQDRMPQTQHQLSGCGEKSLESLCHRSEDQHCVDNDLPDKGDLFMKDCTDSFYSRITALYSLSTKELRELWFEKFGTESAPHMQKRALIERIAYAMQEQAFGGLSDEAQKRLAVFEDRLKKGKPLLCEKEQLAPGTILSRDYNGRKHVIRILDDEKVEYEGKVHNSLSAVARAITGIRWNGRKFFHVEECRC
jgi:hypothetical protein